MKNVPEGDPDQIESEVSCKGLVIGKNGAAHPGQADETETPSTVKDEDDIASHGHANRKKKAYRSRGRKMRPRRIQRPQPGMHPDTNIIYPPDRAYEQANNELKSPTKKRPLSGGPSPDKGKLQIDEPIKTAQQIFREHRETQILLNKARSNIQQTRLEVKATIAQSQETISQYQQFMEKHKQKMEQKVDDYLKQNHFQLAPASESAFEEEEQLVRPKSKYL